MGPKFTIKDVATLAADLHKFAELCTKGLVLITTQSVEDTWLEVRRRASHRPGPRMVTGEYVRSIQAKEVIKRHGLSATIEGRVWTDDPRAMRLENGFIGADKLGRIYHQPPFPHWGPTLTHQMPRFYAKIDKGLDKWWKEAMK